MVTHLHILVKDKDGNLQDIMIPALMSSECSLSTENGILAAFSLEGIFVDVLAERKPEEIIEFYRRKTEAL